MVVIKTRGNMFWGVTIDAGKRYSQVVKQGFHVSMAALEVQAKKPSENVQVLLQHESTEYLLCTLNGTVLQQNLDLNFETGEQVSFCLNGSGVVHLSGFLIPDEEEPDFDESFSGSEDDEAPSLVDASGDGQNKGKRKAAASAKATKKIKLSESIERDDDDDSDDEDYDSEEEEGFSDDFDNEFEDTEDEVTIPEKKEKNKTQAKLTNAETPASQKNKESGKTPKQDGKSPKTDGKTPKPDGKTPATPKQAVSTPKQDKTPAAETVSKLGGKVQKQDGKSQTHTEKPVTQDKKTLQDSKSPTDSSEQANQQNESAIPSASGSEESAKKKKKKKKKKKNKEGNASQNESTDTTPTTTPKPESQTPKKRVVAGGTVVEDLKVGHGPEAKPGKMASVYYVGTLAKTSKRFDSCTEGKPFRFRLNQGEVIKGWDNGVLGMKVGGKRRITVPANQGYGNVKQGPIPPNSTLVFEVELKAVS
ncbi:hypothetical protein BsWGS_01306 [Bradybaena similaris]